MRTKYLWKFLVIFGAYFFTAKVGLELNAINKFATYVWAPSGIALAALLIFGFRLWPAIYLAAFLINLSKGAPFWVACGIALGNTGEALLGNYLLQRVAKFQWDFERLRDVIWFVFLGAVVSPVISATLGPLSLLLGHVIAPSAYQVTWLPWWFGDAMGILLLTPWLLILSDTNNLHFLRRPKIFAEGLALIGVTIVLGLMAFADWRIGLADLPRPYFMFPILLWACTRFQQIGVTTVSLITAVIAIWSVAVGKGSFASEPLAAGLLHLQTFLGIFSVNGLIYSAVVSERQRADRKLKENIGLLSAVIEGSQDAIFVKDFQGRYQLANTTAVRILGGKDASDIIGKSDLQLMPKTSGRKIREDDFKILSTGQTLKDLEVEIAYNGQKRVFSSIKGPFYDARGKIMGIVGIARDVTEHKESEKRLKRNATAQKFLAEAGAILSSSLDYTETLTGIAKLIVPELGDWCVIYVREPGDPRPRSVAVEHRDPIKREKLKRIQEKFPLDWDGPNVVARVIRTGGTELLNEVSDDLLRQAAKSDEHFNALKDFGIRSTLIVPLATRQHIFGAITFAFAESGRVYDIEDIRVAKDLAYRAGVAVENAILYKEARQAIHIRDEFLSIASHELKTPITSLKMQIQMTQLKVKPVENVAPPPEKLARVLDISSKQVDRLTDLVEDLLDVSRIQSGRLAYVFEETVLKDVIDEVIERFHPQFAGKNVSLSVDVAPEIVGKWDRSRIEQVFMNLFSNALKYAPGGPIVVKARQEGAKVLIVVEDSGPGIPAEKRNIVFDRFTRVTNSKNISGLGLGLFIVKNIVEAHGGKVSLEDAVPHGARFIVEIPVDPTKTLPQNIGQEKAL